MRRSALLFAFLLCACDGLGPIVEPLPNGGLPATQTLEGGAQIQISPAGFEKIESTIPGGLGAALDAGFCVPQQSLQASDVCYTNQGACMPGCNVAVTTNSVDLSVTNANTLNVRIETTAATSVRIDPPIFSACTMTLSIANLDADVDIGLGIDPVTGLLSVQVLAINDVDASGVNFSGCSTISFLGSIVTDLMNSLLGAWIVDSLRPAIETQIAARLPAALESAGMLDLAGLALVGPDASDASLAEARVAPGGYVNLNNAGLALGAVLGFNADAEPATRAPALVSEPAACVAGLAAPTLGGSPTFLPMTSRGSFFLPPANSFAGSPMPVADVQLGLSNTALDLAGHHLVASGGLCLDVEAERVAFLRRDALDDLFGIPLAAANTDLRLRVRPQSGVRFEIGTGLAEDPHLTAIFDDLEIDVDAVSDVETTPALTLAADVEVDLQLETRTDGEAARLEPIRVALRVIEPDVTAYDARYAAVGPPALDALAATAADVVFSALGADAGVLSLPDIAGNDFIDPAVSRVDTINDAFLAVSGSLGTAAEPGDPVPTPAPTSVSVDVPEAAALRSALVAGSDAELPTLHVELPNTDGPRALEHTWRTRGGSWRPYQATGDMVIRDRSFAWQGEHEIELRSRAVGTDDTISPIASVSAVVDYAAPTLLIGPSDLDGPLELLARDAASDALEFALGRVGESEPQTVWSATPSFDRTTALTLGDSVLVYVRDDSGHVAQAEVQLVPEPAGAAVAALACIGSLARRARRAH